MVQDSNHAVIRRNASPPSLVTAIAAATGQTPHSNTTTGARTSISANCASEASAASPNSATSNSAPSPLLPPAAVNAARCSPTPTPSKP